MSVDKKCSPEGCWYCHHRCHSCMKPASVGYTRRDGGTRQLVYNCSKKCICHDISDIPESTILDVTVGKVQCISVHGTYLLLSATVVLEKGLQRKSAVSTQVAISFGSKNIPEGVVYAITRINEINSHAPQMAVFIQHNLTPVKCVWDPVIPQPTFLLMEMMRKKDVIKRNLQPVFKAFGCDDLPSFLEQKFPHLHLSFMDQRGVIYPRPPTRLVYV